MRKWYNKEVHFLYSLSKSVTVKQEISQKYACWKHPDEVIGGSKSHDRGQERRVGMYSTPTEVNIYIYIYIIYIIYKAVGEMHPSLQI